jgi:hypothetical protein
MAPISRIVRISFVLVGLSTTISCNKPGAEREDSACPRAEEVVLPKIVYGKVAPISFHLPADSFHLTDFTDHLERGQAWSGASGLVVSYAVQSEPIPFRPISTSDEEVFDCVETIGGRVARLRGSYSEVTTAPGQRVIAEWPVQDGILVLRAFHPDRDKRAELLQIVRSTQFTNVAEEEKGTPP